MNIFRMDIEKRLPSTLSTSGYYYWTNSYHFSGTGPTDWPDQTALLIELDYNFLIDDVQVGTWKVTRLSDGIVVDQLHSYHPRIIPVAPGPYVSLANTVFAIGKYEDGSRWYKRYRFPLRAEDMQDGGLLSDALFALQAPRVASLPDADVMTSVTGSPLVSAEMSPLVHCWQWRDGTKRRSRSVLFP